MLNVGGLNLLTFAGVLIGLLLIDLQFDLPLLRGQTTSENIHAAFTYYRHMDSTTGLITFALPVVIVGSLIMLLAKLWIYLAIEDILAFASVGASVFFFANEVIAPREELPLATSDEEKLKLLLQVGWGHVYIFVSTLVFILLQIGGNRSIIYRQNLANNAPKPVPKQKSTKAE
eukprot:TRINITY_DN1340_c0_g1_i1.p1 TRINITY_DN1340_c0_g1~~TRINITY_DN1340_c0_g1_i1.p1  ORF type:complete len:174 (-),score=52.77 TRINITY_DN1340_c0_g1_i1:76-597(-)